MPGEEFDTYEIDIANRISEQVDEIIRFHRGQGWLYIGLKKNNSPNLPAIVLIFIRRRQEKDY